MRVQRLTAEALLSSPRRAIALPNPTGTHLLYTVSTHSFTTSSTFNELRVMDIRTGGTKQIVADNKVHDAQWLPGPLGLIIYLREDDEGRTQVKIANTGDLPFAHRLVATLEGSVRNLKIRLQDDGTFVLVVTGLVGEDGGLGDGKEETKKTTGRIFDTPNVRVVSSTFIPRKGVTCAKRDQWNTLYSSKKYGLWYTTLTYDSGWFGLKQPLTNLLKDTDLEPAGVYGFGNASTNFDISDSGIAFIARDTTNRDPSTKLNTKPFYCAIGDFASPSHSKPNLIHLPQTTGPGVQTNMRISPESSHIGFLHYSNDDAINQKLYVAPVKELAALDVNEWITGETDPDTYERPSDFEFAGRWDEVIMTKQKETRIALAHLKLQDGERPRYFTFGNSVMGYHPYLEGRWDRLLVTSCSMVESCVYQIVDVQEADVKKTISCVTQNGKKFGLSEDMVSELWFEGADELCVHALVVKPSDCDEGKKYPWVLMPHGGPLGAWANGWGTGVSLYLP